MKKEEIIKQILDLLEQLQKLEKEESFSQMSPETQLLLLEAYNYD